MKKESRNMYKVGFAETLLLLFHKLEEIDKKIQARIS